MIQVTQLSPGVTLRCFRDSRFKQGCLSLQLLRPMCAGEAAMNALLPDVLLRGTRQKPQMRSIVRHLDTLYGASISALVRRIGDCQTTGFYCGFMDDRFALPGDWVLQPVMEFLAELLRDPALEDGCFRREVVENEKDHLIATIQDERNDKAQYAISRLLKSMCREDSFGLPRLGEAQDVAAITPQALTDHYHRILRESPMELLYVGSQPPEVIIQALAPIFRGLERQPMPRPEQTGLHPSPGRELSETMDVTQGKLCLGYVTPITNRSRDFVTMQVLNTLFGAGMTSKLFMNLREKSSLCYSIGSAYYGAKGILTVSAGIDFDKEAETRRQIEAQLIHCREGRITPEELAAAREALLSSLRAVHDSPGAIESYYGTAILSPLCLSPAEYMQAVEAVTPEQVVAAANSLRLHSSFFLKGDCPCP